VLHVSRDNENTSARADKDKKGGEVVGTSGRDATPAGDTAPASAGASKPLTDAAAIGSANRELVGRQVDLSKVEVARSAAAQGFWIASGNSSVFVLPAPNAVTAKPTAGQKVDIDGVMLEMPKWMRARSTADGANEHVYIYASAVK
jgi:hypothetical protein